MSIFVFMLCTLQVIYWIVGKKSAQQNNTQEEYFLAGKKVQLLPLMMTFLATQVGGGIFLGAADEAYQYGWPVLLYPLGAAFGLMLLGSGIGRKLAEFPVSTVAELFELVYRSKILRKIASLLSVISLFMILVAQFVASSKFLVSMGITSTPLFLLFWGSVIYYTVKGGLNAVIATDLVQAAFFSFALLFSFGTLLWIEPKALEVGLPSFEAFSSVSSKLTGWLLMPLLFMVIEQDMAQRCFAGNSPKTVSKAAFLAGIATLIVCVVPVFIGVFAKEIGIVPTQGGSILMETIAATTGPWITALIGCAVIAAIISTATSLISAISSNLISDFTTSNQVRTSKGITLFISALALFAAFFFNNIVDILILSYELSVACLFVPVLFALIKKEGCYLAALLSLIFGAIGVLLFRWIEIPLPREIATLLLSFMGYGLGIFTAYRRVGYTTAIESKGNA